MLNSFLMVVYLGRIPPKEYRRRAMVLFILVGYELKNLLVIQAWL